MKLVRLLILCFLVVCLEGRKANRPKDNSQPPKEQDRLEDEKDDIFGEQKRMLAKQPAPEDEMEQGPSKKDIPKDVLNDPDLMKEAHKLQYYGIRIGAREECTPTCKRKQLCLVDTAINKMKCISKHKLKIKGKYYLSKFALRWKRRLRNKRKRKDKKLMTVKTNDVENLTKDIPDRMTHKEYMKKKLDDMKARQKAFENKIQKTAAPPEKTGEEEDEEEGEKDGQGPDNVLNPGQDSKSCTKQQLADMGRRLLDWFKLLQEYHKKHPELKRRRSKRRKGKAKDLSKQGKCSCLQPVSWQFSHLDVDNDGHLSSHEMKDVENNGYEQCVKPFIESCDVNKDKVFTGEEWCCCFAEVLPPCLSTVKSLPVQTDRKGRPKVTPGLFVPKCDSDGFYLPEQCHSSVGQCWCVDRNGRELDKSRVRGNADCQASNTYIRS
ncbi:proteoglycan Cow-like [Lineus longissimus]|uniref:proteoglycan Cow-like n=1 Tax=Lineus longissimus TaxID=88925 RepID=UPI002B4F4E7F